MSTVGDRIKEYRNFLGLTQKRFAVKAGVPLRTLASFEINERKPGYELIRKIALTFAVDLNWLITGQTKKGELPMIAADTKVEYEAGKKLIATPIINEVPAGYPSYPVLDDYVRDHIYLPKMPQHVFGLYVSGRSMEPEIYDNDLVIVDPSVKEIREGEIGVFRVNDETTIKRCMPLESASGKNEGYVLQPSNPKYKPILIHGEVECTVIGKVIYKIIKCK